MELSSEIRRAVRRYEPITAEGLTLYPIRVKEYDQYLIARSGLVQMQQAFPVRLISMPLLAACYRMDYEASVAGETPAGLFWRLLLFLALSLRLGEGQSEEKRVNRFHCVVDQNDMGNLKCVTAEDESGKQITVTPLQFQRLRPILAAQNGVELESDMANPELVEAERDLAEMNGPKLDVRLEDLIATVAAVTGSDESEMDDWPILKLDRRRDAVNRVLGYLVCGIGEASGAKWKGGNPVPSPFFRKLDDESAAMLNIGSFAGGGGVGALKNAGL